MKEFPPAIEWEPGDFRVVELEAAAREYALENVRLALLDAFKSSAHFLRIDEDGKAYVWCASPHENLGLYTPLAEILILGADDDPEPLASQLEALAARIRHEFGG